MTYGPRDALVRAGLELGDAFVGILPTGAAYGLADLLGRAWFRAANGRRRLVAANLARVNAAIGQPLHGAALRDQVRAAFVAHARYYLEVARLPRHAHRRQDNSLIWEGGPDLAALLAEGGIVGVSAHYGNFEPAAVWMQEHGLRWVTPVEAIEPRALFDYLRSRRAVGSASGELVAAPGAARRVLEGLRNHEMVAIASDRDVGTATVEVDFFGHRARMPSGPATLAVITKSPVVVVTLRRSAPGQFVAWSEQVEWTPTADRHADIQALTQRVTEALERHISEAPEQWWGAFQPVWDDLTLETVQA
jgi:KDO2-lipid IV(A) lauroyltransferase